MRKWLVKQSKEGYTCVSDGANDVFCSFTRDERADFIVQYLNDKNVKHDTIEFIDHFNQAYREYCLYLKMLKDL